MLNFGDYLSWGLVAFIGMFILGITSNKLSAIKLKRNWKKVQRLAYPAFAFTMIHAALASREGGSYIALLVIYSILKAAQYYIPWQIKKIEMLKAE